MKMDKVGTHTAHEGISALMEVWTLQILLISSSEEEEVENAAALSTEGTSIGAFIFLGVLVETSPTGNLLN